MNEEYKILSAMLNKLQINIGISKAIIGDTYKAIYSIRKKNIILLKKTSQFNLILFKCV